MGFEMRGKKMKCNDCGYTGKVKMKNSELGMWLLLALSVIVAFFFIPVFIVAGFMLYYLVYRPVQLTCPECGNSQPAD